MALKYKKIITIDYFVCDAGKFGKQIFKIMLLYFKKFQKSQNINLFFAVII